jgi:hypothetical protein
MTSESDSIEKTNPACGYCEYYWEDMCTGRYSPTLACTDFRRTIK